jgi:hypothetical protein
LVSVKESPVEGTAKPYYVDGVRYLTRTTPEEYEGEISAFTYPDEFAQCDGTEALAAGLLVTNQYRKPFGLCYRTRIGNDISGADHGYKLHLIYNAMVAPASIEHRTVDDTPDPIVFTWFITATPATIPGRKPSAHLIIDSTKTDATLLAAIEDLLYGSDINTPTLPTPTELFALYGGSTAATVVVVDNGDGTFTVTAPDSVLTFIDASTFQLNTTAVVDHGDGTFTVQST